MGDLAVLGLILLDGNDLEIRLRAEDGLGLDGEGLLEVGRLGEALGGLRDDAPVIAARVRDHIVGDDLGGALDREGDQGAVLGRDHDEVVGRVLLVPVDEGVRGDGGRGELEGLGAFQEDDRREDVVRENVGEETLNGVEEGEGNLVLVAGELIALRRALDEVELHESFRGGGDVLGGGSVLAVGGGHLSW